MGCMDDQGWGCMCQPLNLGLANAAKGLGTKGTKGDILSAEEVYH